MNALTVGGIEFNQQMCADLHEERLQGLQFQYEKVVESNTELNAKVEAQVIIIDHEKEETLKWKQKCE